MKKLITTALVTALTVAPAFAQANSSTSSGATDTMPTTTATTGTTGSVTAMPQATGEIPSSKIVGAAVYNSSNEKIGDVNNLIVDPAGKVAGVVIGVGGFLGMGEHNVAVTFNSVRFDKDSKGTPRLVVPATKDQLKALPAYDASKKG